eukprot:6479150-Alexandrium_andersonii.AAC.1
MIRWRPGESRRPRELPSNGASAALHNLSSLSEGRHPRTAARPTRGRWWRPGSAPQTLAHRLSQDKGLLRT